MTDQTVHVPVYLIKEVADGATLVADYLEGTSGTLSGSAALALKSIVSLIPTPPKVGDVIDTDEVLELPRKSVVVDKDGDPWVVWYHKSAFLAQDGEYAADEDALADYRPFTLVYLAASRD